MKFSLLYLIFFLVIECFTKCFLRVNHNSVNKIFTSLTDSLLPLKKGKNEW